MSNYEHTATASEIREMHEAAKQLASIPVPGSLRYDIMKATKPIMDEVRALEQVERDIRKSYEEIGEDGKPVREHIKVQMSDGTIKPGERIKITDQLAMNRELADLRYKQIAITGPMLKAKDFEEYEMPAAIDIALWFLFEREEKPKAARTKKK